MGHGLPEIERLFKKTNLGGREFLASAQKGGPRGKVFCLLRRHKRISSNPGVRSKQQIDDDRNSVRDLPLHRSWPRDMFLAGPFQLDHGRGDQAGRRLSGAKKYRQFLSVCQDPPRIGKTN